MSAVSLSVVSHGQAALIQNLFADINRYAPDLEVLLTCNIPEAQGTVIPDLRRLRRFDNSERKGFASNHNAAFIRSSTPYFCVSNPDVRLINNPFPELLACMRDPRVGVVTPRVINPKGDIEDSARFFPTLARIAAKVLGLNDGRYPVGGKSPIEVDWAAGMFMLFRAEAFRDIGGFDEDFFLYYEDVDICARLWNAGWKVMQHPSVTIIHAAQRASRKNPLYLKLHVASMTRYLWKHRSRLPRAGSAR